MKTILAFLLLASPCFGQSFGQFTISSTAAIQADKSQAVLIEVSKDRVERREEFFVKIKDDMPYEIRGGPWYEKQEDLGKDGSRLVRLIAGDEDITIVVQHKIIKLTESDLKAMPLFASEEGREAWFYKNASDEVRDSRTVFVGGGPDPDPDPEPNVDLSAKVKVWLSKVDSSRKSQEAKALAELYLQLASRAAAGGITEDGLFEEMTAGHVALGPNARRWFSFFKSFGETVNAAPGLKGKGEVFKSVGEILENLDG